MAVDNKVLIVGAGLGGLALAQILRNNNVPFEIYERDSGDKTRNQGWAVALVECVPHLEKLLPDDLGDLTKLSVTYPFDEADTLGILDAHTGERLAEVGIGAKRGEPGYILRVERERMRRYLCQHLDIKMGKNFVRCQEDQGGVTAYFADGSTARGCMVVGADGSSSHVRSQLLGKESKATIAPYIPIVGDCNRLPRHIYEKMHDLGTCGIMAAGTNIRMLSGLRSIEADRSHANYYYLLCFASEDPSADSAWVQAASQKELYEKCTQITKDMAPILTESIHYAGEEGVVVPPIRFLEYVPPETMPTSRITILGDAAHSMMPFRGAGANTAILDACDLGKMLINSQRSREDIYSIVDKYQKIMLPRGKEMVLSSHATIDDSKAAVDGLTKGRVATVGGKKILVEEGREV